MKSNLALGLTLLMFSSYACASDTKKSTYQLTIEGKKCSESSSQQIDCDYRLGSGLWISIAGIGLPDTSVTFMKSSFEGDFYATYGIMHGCVIVKRGKKNPLPPAAEGPGSPTDYAFVSPKNGKVYRSWTQCQGGM